DQDAPFPRVIEATQQLGDRRLPRAGMADEGDGLSRRDRERHTGKRFPRRIRIDEVHIFEGDRSHDLRRRAPVRLTNRRGSREVASKTCRGDSSLLPVVEYFRERLYRQEEHLEVQEERDQFTGRE